MRFKVEGAEAVAGDRQGSRGCRGAGTGRVGGRGGRYLGGGKHQGCRRGRQALQEQGRHQGPQVADRGRQQEGKWWEVGRWQGTRCEREQVPGVRPLDSVVFPSLPAYYYFPCCRGGGTN